MLQGEIVRYADDTLLTFVGTEVEVLTNHVIKTSRGLFEWRYHSKLLGETAKLGFMIVTDMILAMRLTF